MWRGEKWLPSNQPSIHSHLELQQPRFVSLARIASHSTTAGSAPLRAEQPAVAALASQKEGYVVGKMSRIQCKTRIMYRQRFTYGTLYKSSSFAVTTTMNTTTGTITLNIIIAPAPAVVSAVVIIVCVFIKHHHNGKTVIMGFGFHYNHEIFFPVKTFMLESTLLLSHIHHYIKTRHVLDEDCLIHPDHKLKWGIFFFFFFLAKLESLIHIFPSSVLLDMV